MKETHFIMTHTHTHILRHACAQKQSFANTGATTATPDAGRHLGIRYGQD